MSELYAMFRESTGVCLYLDQLKPGQLFFCFSHRGTRPGVRSWLMRFWGLLEVLMPHASQSLLRGLLRFSLPRRVEDFVQDLLANKANANAYAPEALARGASFVVVDGPFVRGERVHRVQNARSALVDLARYHRQQCGIKTIGITGSCGKTTTKELTTAVLSPCHRTDSTKSNYNTLVGTCETLLRMDSSVDLAVLEISSRGKDPIRQKAEIADTTYGLITNIGKAHLEGFGSVENIVRIKGQLFEYVAEAGGVFFLNLDDPKVVAIVGDYKPVVTFGESPKADVRGKVLAVEPYLKVRWLNPPSKDGADQGDHLDISTKLFGAYNLHNVLGAVAIGTHFGVPSGQICDAIAAYEPTNHRSQIVVGESTTFVLDCYNANPTSMEAALDAFEVVEADRKGVILGDMFELGDTSLEEHRLVVDRLEQMNLDFKVVVGRHFEQAAEGHQVQAFSDLDCLSPWIAAEHMKGAYVLVKGSRGIGLERLVDHRFVDHH